MGMLIQYLGNTPAGVILGWIVALFLAVVSIYTWLEKYRKIRNQYDETQRITSANSKNIQLMQQEIEQAEDIFLEQISKLEQKDLILDEKITHILQSIDSLDKYQKNKDMNDLKDRILKNYRNYKKRAKHNNGIVFVTKNQLEAFEGLIDAYIIAGGNSFVHSEIRSEMINWEVISEEEMTTKLVEK